jgi:phosphoribosyl-ATP pyrophosphohydrolase
MKDLFLELYKTIEHRKKSNKKNSYTKKLFKDGEKKIAQKFGEESSELLIDFLKGSKKRTTEEAVDVIKKKKCTITIIFLPKSLKAKSLAKKYTKIKMFYFLKI